MPRRKPQNSTRSATPSSWKPGQSGNPGGRPKSNRELRAKCCEFDDELIARLRGIAKKADTDSASVQAIKLLLSYGHGSPETRLIVQEDLDATLDRLEQALSPAEFDKVLAAIAADSGRETAGETASAETASACAAAAVDSDAGETPVREVGATGDPEV